MLKDQHEGSASPGPSPTVVCAGCEQRIVERFYLLAADRQWHVACLQCSQCKLPLDAQLTCFSRHGNIYCKDDYYRLFAVKRCGKCQAGIASNELVMRARDEVYHLHCFACASCGVLLTKGDHFGMRDGLVYCRPHYEILRHRDYCGPVELEALSPSHWTGGGGTTGGLPNVQKGRPRKRKLNSPSSDDADITLNMQLNSGALEMIHSGDLSSSMESLSYDSSVTSPGAVHGIQQRTKRMRTSFKHHQLRTMKSYFNINQNPDAKDLKQLAQKTGLSKRVLQVWFQNARAKWRRNIMRQENGQSGGLSAQTGNGGGGVGPGGGAPPSVAPSAVLLRDSAALDDIYRHHAQTTQTLNFADID
nr:PREDICTED: LIM/homeobox protein Lhx9-like [Bemisia tabaci]